MTENRINDLAQSVAKQVWGDSRTSENFLQAREMVEELFNDDELVLRIPGINARAHQALIYDEAVRKLSETEPERTT